MFFVTPVNAMTASELSGKLQTLKSQYPNGTHQTTFYNSTYGGSACYRDLSGHSSWECMAWARKVYDSLWGDSVSNGQFHQNVGNICIGDYVRYYAGSVDHSILVTNIIGDNIYYTDCNGAKINNVSSAGKIQWDRAPISKTDLQSKVNKKLNNSTSGWSYGHIVHYPNNNIKDLTSHTHSHTTYVSTSTTHPHNKIYKCSCGATQENTSQPTFGLECASCLNPITPVAEQEFNGSKYLLFDSSIPWNDAKNYCEQFGGHLATVTSAEENTFLQAFISNGSQTGYWLGATDAESEGTWKWVTGETFSYADWYTDNPNNSGEREHYLEIRKDYNNQWNDDTIDKYVSTALATEGFILEIDMKNYKNTNELLYNGSQYILFDISLPWHYAQEYCESIGGNLAVITSQEENAVIQELISKGNKQGYWLGANDTETEGVWKWVTGETFSYTDWYADNPNNGGDHEHYLEIRKDYGNQWNDDTLDKFQRAALVTEGFICEIDISDELPVVAETSFNGHHYLLFDMSVSWPEAKEYCEDIGGHLATVTSADEDSIIQTLISKGGKSGYWLGATDVEAEGTWKWITGEGFGYTNWYDGNPNNSGSREHYLEIRKDYGNKWNDDTIDKYVLSALMTEGFVCEFELTEKPVDLGDTFYAKIKNEHIGNYVTNDISNVSLRKNNNSSNQIWKFEKTQDGSYLITSEYNNGYLNVYYARTGNNANIDVCGGYNESGAEHWYIYEKNGLYIFRPKCSNFVMSVEETSSAEGVNIQTNIYDWGATQSFVIEENNLFSFVSKNGTVHSVEINGYGLDNTCQIIVCGYSNKKLVDYEIVTLNQIEQPITIVGDIDEIKVMAWNNLSSSKPLCDAKSIPINEWIIQ